MKKISNYKRTLGIITISAGIVSAACIFLGAYAVEYNFEAFSEPTLMLQYVHNHKEAYWFLLLDMAGYYLLLLPVIFYLHQQYQYQSPWVPLFTFSGLAYVLTGATGAAMLASTWPDLMQQYSTALETEQHAIVLAFNTLTQLVTKGLWNILEVLFAGTWWIGFGIMLKRDSKTMGLLSITVGTACLVDSIGTVAGWKIMSEMGVNLYLVLGIIWPIVLGIRLIRQSAFPTAFHAPTTSYVKSKTHVKA
jgi:hypothetical protein